MRARILPFLLAVSLSGCTAEAPPNPPKGKDLLTPQAQFEAAHPGGELCTSSACPVTIKVGAGCAFTVTPPTLGISHPVDEATITWTIDPGSTGTVIFAASNGINGKTGAWNSAFRNGTRVSDTVYTWIDKNKPPGQSPGTP